MNPEDVDVYVSNIDRYENWPDNLDNMCLADVAANYIYEKADMNYETDGKKAT